MRREGMHERLNHLISIGQKRGFVLYDDIDAALSPGREGLDEVDPIISELTRHGIEVVDEPRTEDSIPDENSLDRMESDGLGDSAPLRMYMRELLTVPRLTVEEEKELAKEARDGAHGAEEAEKRLIERNLWIALATATHFLNRGLSFLDLIQEGNIGLMRAVKEYDPERPYRLSTFATWWVRRAIQVALAGLRDQNH